MALNHGRMVSEEEGLKEKMEWKSFSQVPRLIKSKSDSVISVNSSCSDKTVCKSKTSLNCNIAHLTKPFKTSATTVGSLKKWKTYSNLSTQQVVRNRNNVDFIAWP